MERDRAILLDMAKFAQTILELMEGIDKITFNKDIRTQSAILYQLTILGEAVKRLSNDFRQQHSQIPWRDIAGMRDKLIHKYDKIQLDLVWQTVSRDIPQFLAQILPLLPQE